MRTTKLGGEAPRFVEERRPLLTDQLFFSFFGFCAAWIVFWLVVSAYMRTKSGKPLFPALPSTAEFKESRCSGRSLKNLLTRIGGAHRALLVYVKDGELVVTPFFPFNLLFLPEIYGLDYTIPTRSISKLERKLSLFGEKVVLRFENDTPASVELRVRNTDALVRALAPQHSTF